MNRMHQKHVTGLEIWKLACLLSDAFIITIIMHSHVWSNSSHKRCASSLNNFRMQTYFSFCGHHLAYLLA